MQRENAFDADAEGDAPQGEGRASELTSTLHDDAFKRLHAFFFLLAICFFQDHVDPDGVARAEIGEVFAQLRLLRFYKYRIHSFISRQTRSGGASTLRTIADYTQIWAMFP